MNACLTRGRSQPFDRSICHAEGARAIPADSIVDGQVRGYLINASNQRVTPVVVAMCRIRR
jgi:hypothetical protein